MTTLSKLALAVLAVSIFSIGCGDSTTSSTEQSLAAKPQADFSFINKSSGPVWIALMNERGSLFSLAFGAAEVSSALTNSMSATKVDPSGSGIFGTSITATAIPHNHAMGVSLQMYLAIYLSDPFGAVKFANSTAKFSPEPDKAYTFTKGKTIYVTWHGNTRTLDPQTGPLGGLLGTNEDGWPLANNVSVIIPVWSK